ncbi:O-6-methylguanine DNA methyltransferase [Devosia sp. UYZn731]|uniref:methylated-DNA--[protein]-cysteine S-methyltransferase n=1 Tax=Devosia sp. UYZn731 TaxID=3156345 RepID=UPI003397802A
MARVRQLVASGHADWRLLEDEVDAPALKAHTSKVLRFVGSPDDTLNFALHMRGTPFQCRVWKALRAIPVGTTITYTELARRVGEPKKVRAVASACASNAIALAVPCHRVVRQVIVREVAIMRPRSLGWSRSMIVLVMFEREGARTI